MLASVCRLYLANVRPFFLSLFFSLFFSPFFSPPSFLTRSLFCRRLAAKSRRQQIVFKSIRRGTEIKPSVVTPISLLRRGGKEKRRAGRRRSPSLSLLRARFFSLKSFLRCPGNGMSCAMAGRSRGRSRGRGRGRETTRCHDHVRLD